MTYHLDTTFDRATAMRGYRVKHPAIIVASEEEVSDILREYGGCSIATACAIWYDKQVEQASIIINDWINS